MNPIGAAHFEKFFQPHFGKDCRQMIGPIGHGWRDAFGLCNVAIQKIAKAFARNVDIFAVAIDEIHRHAERVINIAFKTHAVFKHPGQHASARIIHIGPDLAAV